MTKVNWTISDQNVSLNYEGQTHIIKRTDALADRLIKAIKEGRTEEIPALVDAGKRIEQYSKGKFQVRDGRVMVNGVQAPEALSGKILRFSNDGLPVEPLLKFAAKLQLNPSFRAVNELFQFLEKNDHPLTQNGNFIAYKRVRENFKDIHSGTMDNSVGQVVQVERNQVDEDSSRTCSHGLHVANWDYAHTQFASHNPDTDVMLEVEVDPADVVAIPTDYNQSKMRVCKYKVLGVVTTPFEPETALKVTDYVPEGEDDEEEVCTECGQTDCEDLECVRCPDCGETFCEGECNDECEFCGSLSCSGDCEEEEEDRYPFEDEFVD